MNGANIRNKNWQIFIPDNLMVARGFSQLTFRPVGKKGKTAGKIFLLAEVAGIKIGI